VPELPVLCYNSDDGGVRVQESTADGPTMLLARSCGAALARWHLHGWDGDIQVKAEQPQLAHKDAFKVVAAMWATASENPKAATKAPK